MNTNVKGIVLSAKDYKENDKLLNILSVELGIIRVVARGVKLAKSKLKPYAQVFCFADFEISASQNGYILTGANAIDSFFDITANLDKLNSGYTILSVAGSILLEGQNNPLVFLSVIKSLKAICYSEINPRLVLIKFLCDVALHEGFKLNTDKCSSCRDSFMNKYYFDISIGEFVCMACKTVNCVSVLPSTYNAVKFITNTQLERLHTIRLTGSILDATAALLIKNINHKFGCNVKLL